MNYVVNVPHTKFDLGMYNWLINNIGGQEINWKVLIDSWNRRAVYFRFEADSLAFKSRFGM